MIELKAEGGFRGKKYQPSRFPHTFDGYRLDELHIYTKIETWKDVDDLIMFLKIHKPCFVGPDDAKEAYKNELTSR